MIKEANVLKADMKINYSLLQMEYILQNGLDRSPDSWKKSYVEILTPKGDGIRR